MMELRQQPWSSAQENRIMQDPREVGSSPHTEVTVAASSLHRGASTGGVAALLLGTLLAIAPAVPAAAADWPAWRGPEQNGVSRETALPDTWSREGENVVWRAPYGGRSTPVVMGGRLYIVNLAGSGTTKQERVMCFDAQQGTLLWEHRFNVFLTDIPANRVGWASPAGDPETGNLYVHGVQNTFLCLDKAGKVVWQRQMHEEFGTITGYGGRTHTPVVDGSLVIISFVNTAWGGFAKPGHRYVAFDKRNGDIVWWSEPGGPPQDTTYSTPVVAVVKGTRLLIGGNADGTINALHAGTGEKVWSFKLSEYGINSSVVFWNDTVYACHGEENLDSTAMGRLVAIDPTGTGDVTKTHEKWRIDGLEVTYSSPAIHDGRLYVIDNSANLHAVDGTTGKLLWKHRLGTVMKASPVVADGKIYVGEVNAHFLILRPEDTSCTTLSDVSFPTPDGKIIELNGSPAVANGRIYFTTRDEIYAIGLPSYAGTTTSPPEAPKETPVSPTDKPARLMVYPAEVVLAPAQSVMFQARLYNERGQFIRECQPNWTLKGLKGEVGPDGKLTVAAPDAFAAGSLTATVDGLTGESRLRVVPPMPLTIDFNKLEDGKPPSGWVGAGGKFSVAPIPDSKDDKMLKKLSTDFRLMHGETFFGLPDWRAYTIQADVKATETRRNMPNIGLVNCRYSLYLMGNEQKVRIVSWVPEPRIDRTLPFTWKPDVWYRMKLEVDVKDGKGLIRGMVWPRGEKDPGAWTVEIEDPVPNAEGSPGLQAYSAGTTARSPGAEAFFDNIQVTPNKP